MDLFDMLGINVEVAAEKPKESKKSEKPKKAVPKEKQITYTKGEINTGFCVWHYDFSVSVALAKVQEEFLQEYPGDFVLNGENLLLAYSSQKEEDMTYVLDKDVRVVYGPYQMQLEEEKTVKDALADFGAKFPEFDSCVGVYNKDAKVLYPRIIATEQEPDPRFPVRMGFGLYLIEIKEVPEKADYMSYMKKQYEKAYQVSLDGKAPFHFCQATNTWIPCFAKKRNNVEKKPSETVYDVPVSVRIPGRTLIFSKEQFLGKEKVTAEEIRKALELEYFEYSKERTKMEWDKDHNLFIAVLKTSSKGAARVRKEAIGEYTIGEDGEILAFRYTLPKIPIHFITKLIYAGRDAYPKEVALQLFYDGNKYFLHKPEQKAGNDFVTFIRDTKLELENVLVADMHTHGAHPAFFSKVDDRDELGFRLYFVVGNLCGSPEIHWRVGGNGHFLNIPAEDIIEQGRF